MEKSSRRLDLMAAPTASSGTTVVVLHSPPTHDDALLQLCGSFGEVVTFARSSQSQVEVSFEEQEDARAASGNMNGMPFHGVYLHVQSLEEIRRAHQQQQFQSRGHGHNRRHR